MHLNKVDFSVFASFDTAVIAGDCCKKGSQIEYPR